MKPRPAILPHITHVRGKMPHFNYLRRRLLRKAYLKASLTV